jgi:hypothetical protein
MDDKTLKPREQWSAAEQEDVGGGMSAPGTVREARDMTEDERSQLLSGYTTESIEDSIAAAPSGMSTAGVLVGGESTTGVGYSAGSSSGGFSSQDRFGGTASYGASATGSIGSQSPISGSSAQSSFGVGGAGSDLESGVDQIKSTAKAKVKDVAQQATRQAADRAKAQVDSRKGQLADQLEGAASQLQEKLAGKAEEVVSQVGSVADMYASKAAALLREKSSDELLSMANDQFRARPLAIAAGFFALGFLGARLLRS